MTNPDKDVNASDDFLTMIVTAHFLAACIRNLGIESLDDTPLTGQFDESTWMKSDDDRRCALYSFCLEISVALQMV